MANEKKKSFNVLPYISGAVVLILIVFGITYAEKNINNTSAIIKPNTSSNLSAPPTELAISSSPYQEHTEITDTEQPTKENIEIDEETISKSAEEASVTDKMESEVEKVTEKNNQITNKKTDENKADKSSNIIQATEQPTYQEPPQNNDSYEEPIVIQGSPKLSQTTVYVKSGQSASVTINYPAGMAAQGASWVVDNKGIASFGDIQYDRVVINGHAVGTTYVHTQLTGYNIKLSCVVVVVN